MEAEILPTLRELRIGLVAYSPLERGILTGAYRRPEDLPEGDARRQRFPRFADGNMKRNVALVAAVEDLAGRRGATPGQVALAWVLAQGDDVVPIPGTKRRRYLEENLAAAELGLSAEEASWLAEQVGAPAGDRYADMSSVNR